VFQVPPSDPLLRRERIAYFLHARRAQQPGRIVKRLIVVCIIGSAAMAVACTGPGYADTYPDDFVETFVGNVPPSYQRQIDSMECMARWFQERYPYEDYRSIEGGDYNVFLDLNEQAVQACEGSPSAPTSS
jgi:hypothetical protein